MDYNACSQPGLRDVHFLPRHPVTQESEADYTATGARDSFAVTSALKSTAQVQLQHEGQAAAAQSGAVSGRLAPCWFCFTSFNHVQSMILVYNGLKVSGLRQKTVMLCCIRAKPEHESALTFILVPASENLVEKSCNSWFEKTTPARVDRIPHINNAVGPAE